MYNILLVSQDRFFCQALQHFIEPMPQFTVVSMVPLMEMAREACPRCLVDVAVIDEDIPYSRKYTLPEDVAVILASFSARPQRQNPYGDRLIGFIEKPAAKDMVVKLLEGYAETRRQWGEEQTRVLRHILQEHAYEKLYYHLDGLCRELIAAAADRHHLRQFLLRTGQSMLDASGDYGMSRQRTVTEYYPLYETYVQDERACSLWLYDIGELCFKLNCLQTYPVMKPVFAYIDSHINSAISLNTIVQNCAISQGYLSRIFKEQYHVSVMDYLHLRRMFQAKGYLYFTGYSVGQIALLLGYSDSSYFSKIFKKYAGMTCREFRDRVKPT